MVITGAFFCEAARAYEGKLNVLGGVWDWLYIGEIGDGQPLQLQIVVLVQRETGETGPSRATMSVRDPSGSVITRAEVDFEPPAGSVLGFFTVPVRFLAQNYGRFVVELSTSAGLPTAVGLNVARDEDDRP